MSLLPFFQWLNDLAISKAISESAWIFAVVQAVHLVTLAMFMGALFVVDLRLLGRGFTNQSLRQVARDAQPWLIAGFIGLILTGIPQLLSLAIKEYNSGLFWIKMDILVVAFVFMLTIRRKILLLDEDRIGPVWGKVVGLVSTGLWLGVAIPARLIGLF